MVRPARRLNSFICDMQSKTAASLRKLGNSDFAITPIGFGAWAIGGGGWEYSLGPQDDRESIAAIHCALDWGINWVDTAAVNGTRPFRGSAG
jgi:aryl-alcohol dehydrogenase-like predicted oxidoreductase